MRSSLLLLTAILLASCTPTSGEPESPPTPVRISANPVIAPDTPGNVDEWGYQNINGPSVIRVPDWVEQPLGRYYLYFAHHRGSFIRMAYANNVEGPWTIHKGGVLDLADTPALDHIASPDVVVDPESRQIRMFYHSVDDTTDWVQTTYLATSSDGVSFVADPEPKGPPYLRAFEWDGGWWAISKVRGGPGGLLLKGASASGPFEEGPEFIPGMRHGAVRVGGDGVEVVFSRIGDAPERLLVTRIDPERMWSTPYVPEFLELLSPETAFEGANLPINASAVGEEQGPVHALRDPYVFEDDGRTWLFYSVAGENGIGLASWNAEDAWTNQAPDGFSALFNGTDLDGWYGHGTEDPRVLWSMEPDSLEAHKEATREDIRQHWSVENGELVNDGNGLYLTTNQDYGDFELMLEYKTVPGADSGVYLRGVPQVQIWDTTEEGGKWNLGADKGSGGLWNNSPGAPGKDPSINMDKPFGEWNAFRIRMQGERVSVWMNGVLVVDDAVMENYFDRSNPIFERGPIQLQTHGGEIRWRNVFIRELD